VSRVSVKRSLSHVLNCCSYSKYLSWSLSLILAKRKIHFMNSALSIPLTFSCALDTFLEKNIVFVFSTFIKFSCDNWIHSFLLAHAQDIVGIFAILFFSRWCFRPEVSLRIIVKCNVNRQGSEMEDEVQLKIGLVFITMREWFPCHLKEVRVLVNALSVVKSFYFCTKISRLIQITKSVK